MRRRALDDASLVASARAGDLDAFDHLVARHRARVFGIAREITSESEAAQDVVQEAFLRAFRSLSALRDHQRFGEWLNTIVRREARGWLRGGTRRPEPADDLVLRGAPVVWVTSVPVDAELAAAVRASLGVLTQRERRAMILHYLEGRSCGEIAAELGISTGSVKRLLHYSRRKARKEARAMAAEEQKGARRLRFWINGRVSPWSGNVFDHMRPLLAQSVTLSVNKQEKTPQQIAEEVGAGRDYVEETAEDLLEMDVLTCPKKGRYLASFIAFDAEDWRRVTKLVKEPAAEAAKRLAADTEALRDAFGRTCLAASGWQWEEVLWTVYSILVANFGAQRHEPKSYHVPLPARPQGGQYLMGGYESAPGLPVVWLTGFNSYLSSRDLNIGCFWTYGLERKEPGAFRGRDDAVQAFLVFAKGPLAEKEALARLGGDAEHWRGILASLVQDEVLQLAHGKLRSGLPFLTPRDAQALAPAVDAIMGPVITDVAVPALAQAPSLLDEMGYGHWRDQYPQWQRWLCGNIMGEALRFLMAQGVLSRPSHPAPANFASVAWQGGFSL